MFFFAFCMLVYFLPSIIGHSKRSFTGILVLNLLLGWTVIGWFAALIWACTDEPSVPVYVAPGPNRYCSRCGAMGPAIAQYCWACGARVQQELHG
ncbi:MAG TPA: superinfection immunity protein [Candidatus Baltobacteraceae bacterium]|nr:superinfection immunity protein [Candidatus Baltobacteraceae bacterium]